jgi:hypothetical protein
MCIYISIHTYTWIVLNHPFGKGLFRLYLQPYVTSRNQTNLLASDCGSSISRVRAPSVAPLKNSAKSFSKGLFFMSGGN